MNETPRFGGDAVNELFAQHYQAAFRTARRILHSREDSEDAVQDAFLNAFRGLHALRGQSGFRLWIQRIVVNCCLVQLRKRRGRREMEFDDARPVARPFRTRPVTPETLCWSREVHAAHARAVSRLPQRLHDVYVSCGIRGTTLDETARQLGLTLAATKSRLHRARKTVEDTIRSSVYRRAT